MENQVSREGKHVKKCVVPLKSHRIGILALIIVPFWNSLASQLGAYANEEQTKNFENNG